MHKQKYTSLIKQKAKELGFEDIGISKANFWKMMRQDWKTGSIKTTTQKWHICQTILTKD